MKIYLFERGKVMITIHKMSRKCELCDEEMRYGIEWPDAYEYYYCVCCDHEVEVNEDNS